MIASTLKARLRCAAALAAGAAHAQADNASNPVSSVIVTGAANESEASTGYKASRSLTATKTDTPLINVPQSVTVVTVRSIEDRAANGIGEAIAYVPGVQSAQGENNRETLVLRGNSTTGDFFVDGIRDDVQTYRDLYNIERLEVFKGPNAMIFGRGGIGGVVNRVTKQAGFMSMRQVRVEGGSFDHFRISGDVNQVVSDAAAVRLTGVYQDSGSFRTDADFKRWGVNPTATFKLSPSTTIFLGYEHFWDERVAERGVPSQPRINGITATQVIGPLKTGRSTVFGDPANSPTWTDTDAVTAAVEHVFNDKVSIRSRIRYADYDKFYQNIFPGAVNATASTNPAGLPAGVYAPGTIVQISAYNNAQKRKNLFNQTDLNVALDTGAIKHTILAGFELGRQTTDNVRLEGFFPTAAAPTGVSAIFAPVNQPNIRTTTIWRAINTSGNNYSVAKVAAGYIQDQIEITPQIQVIVGIRYDHFNVRLTDRRSDAFRAGAPSQFDVTDNLWSPRAGLIYKPVENASIYVAYSRTYQPRAGDQLASLSLTTAAFDPEKFDSYEIGAKWDIRPDLNVSIAAYNLKRTNVIVPIDPNNAAAGTELGGAQRTKGIELAAVGKLTENLSIMGAYAYQDGKFTRAISATVLAGAQLANLPKHTASLWARYDIGPFGAGLGVIHQSKRFAATDNLVALDGFTRADAALFYKINERFQVQLNVENLFDTKYFTNANSNTNLSPGAPTTVKAALTARF